MTSLFPYDQAGLFTGQSVAGIQGPYVVSVNARSGILTLTHLDVTDWAAATSAFLTQNQPITATGDVTGGPSTNANGQTSLVLNLPIQALTPGTYGGLAVSSKGLITAARPPQLGDITQSGAAPGQVPVWSGSAWVPGAALGSLTAGANITISPAGVVAVTRVGFPVDLYGKSLGVLAASQPVLEIDCLRALAFAVGLPGSIFRADVAAKSATTLPILHNGTACGSVLFAAGSATGTVTFPAAITTAAGDNLQIIGPATPDANLAGVRAAITGTQA